jgi:cell division protein FtsQ
VAKKVGVSYDASAKNRPAGPSGTAAVNGFSRAFVEGLKNGRLLSLLGLMGLVALVFYLYSSPAYRIETLEVSGSKGLPVSELEARTDLIGRNVFVVNIAEAEEALRPLPYVRNVKIEAKWPNRVVVTVDERVPSVAWQVGNDNYLVDNDGVVVEAAEPPADLITVVSSEKATLKAGDKVNAAAVDAAQKLYLRLPRELNLPVTHLDYSPLTGITVTSGDKSFCFGTADELDQKMAILQSFWGTGTNWKYLDLRSIEKPYYR